VDSLKSPVFAMDILKEKYVPAFSVFLVISTMDKIGPVSISSAAEFLLIYSDCVLFCVIIIIIITVIKP
jgi:hypothetical protein